MKIYTRTGDDGTTGLFGGPRVLKHAPRIEAYGSIDELNSWLGMCRSARLPDGADAVLEQLQCDLFAMGAELASPHPEGTGLTLLGASEVARLEAAIDRLETLVSPLKNFILPGGSSAAAHLHVARCVCRRAERAMSALHEQEPIREFLLQYVNRVSDLLFVMARAANATEGRADTEWHATRGGGA